MGTRAKFLDILDTKEIFEKYWDNVKFDSMVEIEHYMKMHLKNKIYIEQVSFLSSEVDSLRDKIELIEVEL
ncbi:MAG: hypothetical protein GX287_02965 [Fusobacteria bacterium]|nr:hypothetical protein [Fusobacteriota bacterium]